MFRQAHWKWTTLLPLLAIASVFGVTVLDPFEWDSVTKRWSAKILYKVYAAVYPTRFRDDITVVFLDEDTLEGRRETWPPTHLVHGDVLTAILDYQPASILVDMFFTEQRPGDHFQLMEKVVQQANGQGVPLFFIGDANAGKAGKVVRPEILAMQRANQLRLVSADVEFEPGVTTLYPMKTHRAGSLELKPAALAVAEANCSRLAGKETCEELRRLAEEVQQPDELEVVWGLQPSLCENVARYSDLAPATVDLDGFCANLLVSYFGRPVQLLRNIFVPEHDRTDDPVRVPYHASLSAEQVLDGDLRDRLTPLLKDRIVIYAARHALLNDRAFSPVHGPIDGAFVHAMAIDNLLTFGGRYMYMASKEGVFDKTWTDYQPILLMLAAALAVIWNRRNLVRSAANASQTSLSVEAKEELLEKDERFLRWVHRSFLAVCVALALIEFFLLHIAPYNWFGLIAFGEAIHQLGRRAFAP